MVSSALLQSCTDLTDVVALSPAALLYLKPIARVTVTVQLPKSLANTSARPGTVGKSISNWEVMEKIKSLAKPIVFSVIKVSTSTLEMIRYEGEVDNKDRMLKVIHALDGQTIKLSGYSEVLRVACGEAKLTFPQRHDWTAFFRDAQNLNGLKPGERPDTVVLQNLPCKWFAESKVAPDAPQSTTPSAVKVKETFELFGEVRAVDMPILDPCRNTAARTGAVTNNPLTLGHELAFDAFVQFSTYNSFVRCLTALCGMKLLWKEAEDKASTANIKVDFDKTQHMSDRNRRKRRQDRAEYRRLEKERELRAKHEAEEVEKRRRQEEEKLAEETRLQEQKLVEREERRRRRREVKVQKAEQRRHAQAEKQRRLELAMEERKLLLAQRQLESIRLLSHLLDRLKDQRVIQLAELERVHREQEEQRRKDEERQREIDKDNEFRAMLSKKEQELRNVLLRAKRHEERKQKKSEEKRLKKIKRRDRRIQKSLLDGTVQSPKVTPDLRRFLDDLPVLYDGPIPRIDTPTPPAAEPKEPRPAPRPAVKSQPTQRATVASSPVKQRQANPETVEVAGSAVRRPRKRPLSASPKKGQVISGDFSAVNSDMEVAVKRPVITAHFPVSSPPYQELSIVVVVPGDQRGGHGKEPLFTTPKNILYC